MSLVTPVNRRILFTGYAPVHFACFCPLYERLQGDHCEVFVSGGFRSPFADGWQYDAPALYEPLGIPQSRILSVPEIKRQAFDVLFSANTKLIEPGQVTTKVQIFHGVSFRNRAVRDENAAADFYFLVGRYMRRKFVETGLLTADDPRGLSIGFMKTDRLLDGSLSRDALLARYELDGRRPVLLYAPTGEKYNSLETTGEEVLAQLAKEDRYDVLVKLHDHPKHADIDWPARLARFAGPHFRLVRDYDVTLPLFLADLLITDASSVSNEYALLDRPIVFLDVPRLLKVARKRGGAMVDLDTWGRRAGTLVERPDQVAQAVEDSLAHPERHREIRKALAADMFYHPGEASRAGHDWIRALLPGLSS
jgi:hypothetical protein